jgi:TusA-related sulfurtransferase
LQGTIPKRKVVDSRGTWCPPTPLTDLFKAWREANVGDEIELWATEPGIDADVKAWALKSGNQLIEVGREGDCTKMVVKVTRMGKRALEVAASKKSMNEPDEVKDTPGGRLHLITVGDFTIGLRTLQPGWRWSTSMKPIAKTQTCQVRHIGYVVSGRMGFAMDDGAKLEVEPGDGFDVHAGHDAWTIGKDPFVFIDLITAAEVGGTTSKSSTAR